MSLANPAERRPGSKTMRLDILPNSDVSQPQQATATYAKLADASGITLTVEMLRHLYDHAYDAMLITNLRGEILSGNLRATEYLIGEQGTVVGLNMLAIISGADAALLKRLCSTLATVRFVRIHAWCQRSSGEFFPAEIAVHLITGGPAGYLCFFMHDITWRKETEDRLQMADVAIRTTPAGIAVIDMEGNLVFANPALNRLFGHAETVSLDGCNLAQFVSDPELPGLLLQAVSEGNDWHGRVGCVREDDSRVVAECEAAGNFNSDGDLIGAVLALNDMTDHLRAAEAERTVERNRVMMASIGSMCHHLGQPSTVLLNSMELLLRLGDGETARRRELLQISLSAAESLRQLLRELNDLRTYRSEAYLAHSQPDGDQIIAMAAAASGTLADADVIDD
jgi:PAS domain S-box-containing protein